MSKKKASDKSSEPAKGSSANPPNEIRVTRSGFDPQQFLTARSAAPKVSQARLLLDREGNETTAEGQAAAKSFRGQYFVRMATAGPDANKLYDVINYPDAVFDKENRATGRSQYEWRRVSETSFEWYVRYLSQRNVSCLRQAERTA